MLMKIGATIKTEDGSEEKKKNKEIMDRLKTMKDNDGATRRSKLLL